MKGRLMSKRIPPVLAFAFALTWLTPAAGQMWVNKTEQLTPGPSGSPRVRTEWSINSGTLSLEYSRPSLKERSLDAVVVPDAPWKLSDDDPAVLSSNTTIIFGNIEVPAGTYSLWVIPQGETWILAINKATGPAAEAYAPAQDVGRIAMKMDTLQTPVEQHTLVIRPSTDRVSQDVELRVEFANVGASAPFVVLR